jgi:hypothetical protein
MVELALMERTEGEIDALRREIGANEPSHHQVAALGAYLANVYMGVENIFRRILKSKGMKVPQGPQWHLSLLSMFGPRSSESGLPCLVDDEMMERLHPYRGFRHLFVHGYALVLRWDRLRASAEGAGETFALFRARIEKFLEDLNRSAS